RDAIFTGLVLNSLQRLCQEIALACFAQTVNVLPLIATDDEGRMYVNPQYLTFQLYVESAQDKIVKCVVDSPSFYSKKLNKSIEYINAVANMSNDGNRFTLHLTNISEREEAECKIKIKGFKPRRVMFRYVCGKTLEDKNDFDNPNRIRIETGDVSIRKEDNVIELRAAKHSVNVIVIEGTRS
ncbi:MAG: alpha-L-arabinofuranosidase C-terminal domain-containing protein, partial [Nitrososphaerota archaeon]|nr:alpha-L-arabinofuranosidase C-terminal domain-containing protein [Nitrososphaerota archaeon]